MLAIFYAVYAVVSFKTMPDADDETRRFLDRFAQ